MRGIWDVERKIEQVENKATEINETESEQLREATPESPVTTETKIAK